MSQRDLDIVGPGEIARLMQVHPTTVSRWRASGDMPLPDAQLDSGPVWRTGTVRKWAEATGRQWTDRCAVCEKKIEGGDRTALVVLGQPASVAHSGCAADVAHDWLRDAELEAGR